MKKLTLTAMAALALVLTFTQCKKETVTPVADEGIFVTLSATYGQSGEKTEFTPGDGSFVWSSGVEEYIFVGGSQHDGNFGVLHGTGTGTGSMGFSGYLTSMPENGETLHFFYLGKGTSTAKSTLDFSNQDGTLANLTNNHVAIGHTTFNGTFDFDVTFSMMVSFAYFNTSAFVNSSSNAETVYLQGDDVYSSATVDYQNGSITGNANKSINIGQAASGVYVALIPSTTSETTTLNFRSFSKTASMTFLNGIQQGKYYSKNGNALNVVASPATTNTVNLASLTSDYEAASGDILTGTLSGNHKISIANNAIVMLSDVDITCLTDGSEYAGITCSGNANIILDGTNNVVGGVFLEVRNYDPEEPEDAEYHHYGRYPGIYIPSGYTLTIEGNGTLNASSAYANASRDDYYECYAAGIGGGRQQNCGNIVINGGTIVAKGGGSRYGSAGIGAGTTASCGDITITGGNVTATGGEGAAGIGSGTVISSCGNILIFGGTVTATGGNGTWGAGAGIGSGEGYGTDRISSCGDITIRNTVTQVTAKRGRASKSAGDNAHSIGAGGSGGYSTCGTVTIENGANVIQN